MKITAVILAAGSSSRMSHSKQLLSYKGVSLIENITMQLSHTNVQNTLCITGFLHEELKSKLTDHNCTFLHNPHHRQGMSSSLQTAINHQMKTDCDAILVTLSDQPLIPTSHYQRILDVARTDTQSIITTKYGATYGAPTLFKRVIFSDILNLSSQVGTKSIIKANQKDTIFIDCTEAQYDIDTDADYERLVGGE